MVQVPLHRLLAALIPLVPAMLHARPATAPSTAPAAAAVDEVPARPVLQIGVLDRVRVIRELGWEHQRQRELDRATSDLKGEVQAFQERLLQAYWHEQARTVSAARLSERQLEQLRWGTDLEKLPLTREQFSRLATIAGQLSGAMKSVSRSAGEVMAEWASRVDRMYTDAIKGPVRRAAAERNAPVIVLAEMVFYYSPEVDVTDAVIDNAQRFPPIITFPPSPTLNLARMDVEEMMSWSAARRPKIDLTP